MCFPNDGQPWKTLKFPQDQQNLNKQDLKEQKSKEDESFYLGFKEYLEYLEFKTNLDTYFCLGSKDLIPTNKRCGPISEPNKS